MSEGTKERMSRIKNVIIVTSLLQSTVGRRPPPIQGGFAHSHLVGRRVGDRSVCFWTIVFTRGAAAHLPDKPLIVFYDAHGRKEGDGILICRHHTAEKKSNMRWKLSTAFYDDVS